MAGLLFAALTLFSGCDSHRHSYGKWSDPKVVAMNPPWGHQYVQEAQCTNCGWIDIHVIWEK